VAKDFKKIISVRNFDFRLIFMFIIVIAHFHSFLVERPNSLACLVPTPPIAGVAVVAFVHDFATASAAMPQSS
jgi:hypothetical protein